MATETVKKPRMHNEVYHDTSQSGQRKDGSIIRHDCWRADITIVEKDGTLQRVRKRFKTEEEARKFQKEMSKQLAKKAKTSRKKKITKKPKRKKCS